MTRSRNATAAILAFVRDSLVILGCIRVYALAGRA